MKKIDIKCEGSDALPLDKLTELQGSLKTLSSDNFKKLKHSILRNGFTAPFFVWKDPASFNNYLLDGHQRYTVLTALSSTYEIPALPVCYIHADNVTDAKKKLLVITSQYGEFLKTAYMISSRICQRSIYRTSIRWYPSISTICISEGIQISPP